ncbi:proteasome-associated protein ECM29 homolog isoform 1-T7 [Glossina fuscipes fuscipes]
MATMNRPTFQAIRSYSILDYLRLCLWYSAGAVYAPGDLKYLNKLKRYIISNYEESDNNELYQFVKRSVEAKRCETNLLCLHDLLNAASELLASSLL